MPGGRRAGRQTGRAGWAAAPEYASGCRVGADAQLTHISVAEAPLKRRCHSRRPTAVPPGGEPSWRSTGRTSSSSAPVPPLLDHGSLTADLTTAGNSPQAGRPTASDAARPKNSSASAVRSSTVPDAATTSSASSDVIGRIASVSPDGPTWPHIWACVLASLQIAALTRDPHVGAAPVSGAVLRCPRMPDLPEKAGHIGRAGRRGTTGLPGRRSSLESGGLVAPSVAGDVDAGAGEGSSIRPVVIVVGRSWG